MSDTNIPRKFTVAIVGGGIGGLAFAVALAKAGANVDVDIYESTDSFSEVGAGLGMWPRVWDAMEILGLADELKRRDSNLGNDGYLIYHKCDQPESVVCGHTDKPLKTYHRAELLKVLELNLPSHYRTHFGKRLSSYEDRAPSPVTLHFKDGTTAECDIVVGADGIKSAVRKSMFTQLADKEEDSAKAEEYRRCVEVLWSGLVVYRALVPTESLEAEFPDHHSLQAGALYFGKHRSVVSYPVSQGRFINAAALVFRPGMRGTVYDGPWVAQADQAELLKEYADWDPHVRTLLKAMEPVSKWAVNEAAVLPTFISGRVALLGDAAHAMMPNLASGAGQGIEDGLVLAALLSQPETNKDTIERALGIYDEFRRPFAQHIQDLSFKTGETMWLINPRMKHYTAEDSIIGSIPLNELQALIDEDITAIHRFAWATSIRPDLELSVEKLKARAGTVN